MTAQEFLNQYFLWLLGAVAAWSVMIIGTVKWMTSRSFTQFDTKFADIQKSFEGKFEESKDKFDEKCRALNDAHIKNEKEITELKITLPRDYVRREDFIPYSVRISAKLDALFTLIHEIKGGLNERDRH